MRNEIAAAVSQDLFANFHTKVASEREILGLKAPPKADRRLSSPWQSECKNKGASARTFTKPRGEERHDFIYDFIFYFIFLSA